MAIVGIYLKQPYEERDIDVSFADYLNEFYPADTISTATVTINGTGATVDSVQNTSTVVKAWVRGGTSGTKYIMTYKVITAGGRKKEAEVVVKVKEVP